VSKGPTRARRPIIDGNPEISDFARLLFEAPFAVLSHDASEEPAFNYANQAALDLFEGGWGDIVGLKSTSSAEDDPEVSCWVGIYKKEVLTRGLAAELSACRHQRAHLHCIHRGVYAMKPQHARGLCMPV